MKKDIAKSNEKVKDRKMLGSYILSVLKDHTDENHFLTREEIADKVGEIYGVACDRRDITDCVTSLCEKLHYEIDDVHGKGLRLISRLFEESEAIFLIDTILANREIDSKYAGDLANKILSDYSIEQKKRYDYIDEEMQISRGGNRQFFLNIEILAKAIEDERKVEFEYISYDATGNKETHMVVSPYYLTSNSGKYHLQCAVNREEGLLPLQVRFISNIKIVDEAEIPFEEVKGCEKDFDITAYLNENIYMAGVNSVKAEILIRDEKVLIHFYEWFGSNMEKRRIGSDTFVRVMINEQALIRWILQYGDKMELLSPEPTREKVKQIVQRMSDTYK